MIASSDFFKSLEASRPSRLASRLLPSLFTIRGVDIWGPHSLRLNQCLVVRNQVIEKLGPDLPVEGEELQVGPVLLPAGVDVQAHLRVPGQAQKETPLTGLRAALRGGFGAVLTMPNTQPVIDRVEVLEQARREVAEAEIQTGVKVFWSAALTLGQAGESLVDFVSLASKGVKAFTDDGKGLASDTLMEGALRSLSSLGLPLLQHAEFPGHGGVLAPSSVQKSLGVPPYFDDPEWRMVERDLRLLQKFPKARYHVLHVSSAKTVELVKQAKKKSLLATCEVSPHHLLLEAEQISPHDTAYKMNPPLRSRADREVLLEALVAGDIDFVATDHAPHEAEKKSLGFQEAPFGTIGLEACLRVLLDFYARGLISAQRLVQTFSTRPAEFLGLEKEFGHLEVGRVFRAVSVDPTAPARPLLEKEIESLSCNSCFLGHELVGRIQVVWMGEKAWF
ncbi:MAG: dihydroorotase [Bdellovibrio sp.]